MIKVVTISKDNLLFDSYCKKIEIFCENIHNIKLIKNYTKFLKIEDSIAISTFEDEDQILGFSTVLHRPIFNNGVRILNRFYKKESYRFVNNKREVSEETKTMIKQQLDIARLYNFDFAFMSREGTVTPPAFSHYRKYLDFTTWYIECEKYKVCKGNSDCDQFIMWTPLTQDANLNLQIIKEKKC